MNKGQKYVIGRCPNCGASVLYSDNPKDKLNVQLVAVGDDYHGTTHLCSRCKTIYAVIDLQTEIIKIPITGTIST